MIGSKVRSRSRRQFSFVPLIPGLVAWELIGRLHVSFFIPPLSEVVLVWFEILHAGKLWGALVISFETFAMGFSLALALGLILGVLMGRYRGVEHFFDLYINTFMSAPVSALVPVLMVLFGLGIGTIVATVFMFSFFVIVVDTTTGIKSVNPSLIQMARSFGGSEFQILPKVILPGALPEILTGVRLGAIRGIKGMVIGQLLIALSGLGERLVYYGNSFLIPHLYAIILTVIVFSILLIELFNFLERSLIHWKR